MFCDPLAAMIQEDTMREILALLTPDEKVVAMMRWAGRSDAEIAQALGTERSTVTKWMIKARKRIARDLPDAAVWLDGRTRGRKRARRGHGRRDERA